VTKNKKKTDPTSPKSTPEMNCPHGSRLQDCAQEATENQSIDKIRDIIFGHQMRDYEKRFIMLEERTQQQMEALRNETVTRLEAVESFIKKEIDALSDRLKTEKSMRAQAGREISREIKDMAKKISNDIGRLEDRQNKDARETRQQLLDLTKNLSQEISNKHNEVSKALELAVKELNEDKVARSTLSEILLEVAVRTSDDLAKKFNFETGGVKND
jgi:hypothetical protein